VALTNLTQADEIVTIRVKGCNAEGQLLPADTPVDVSKPLTVPALDGVFLVLTAQGIRQ